MGGGSGFKVSPLPLARLDGQSFGKDQASKWPLNPLDIVIEDLKKYKRGFPSIKENKKDDTSPMDHFPASRSFCFQKLSLSIFQAFLWRHRSILSFFPLWFQVAPDRQLLLCTDTVICSTSKMAPCGHRRSPTPPKARRPTRRPGRGASRVTGASATLGAARVGLRFVQSHFLCDVCAVLPPFLGATTN